MLAKAARDQSGLPAKVLALAVCQANSNKLAGGVTQDRVTVHRAARQQLSKALMLAECLMAECLRVECLRVVFTGISPSTVFRLSTLTITLHLFRWPVFPHPRGAPDSMRVMGRAPACPR